MHTITAHTEIDRLFAGGRRVTHPALLVLAGPTPEGRALDGRLLFVAGTRLGGAVIRNRSKRVLREAARRCGGPWASWDIALVARRGTAHAGAADIDRALHRALEELGVAR